MTRLATMGTKSCATIAINGFSGDDILLNEDFFEGKVTKHGDGLSVDKFYNKILYPTDQELGQTASYPFEMLMREIEESEMEDKFTIVTLNSYQQEAKDSYWPKQLKKWGFKLMDKTKNNIGTMCYVYIRNLARPKNANVKGIKP